MIFFLLSDRDAVAKALYSRLFTWLVERINNIICRAERDKNTSLAVLDIFGFEVFWILMCFLNMWFSIYFVYIVNIFQNFKNYFQDFHMNSFEQLCINYANETMQFFFNQHIFRLEQKEYSREGIDWSTIEFRDNQPVIDLLASKPTGILCILDDECSFPQVLSTKRFTDLEIMYRTELWQASNKI